MPKAERDDLFRRLKRALPRDLDELDSLVPDESGDEPGGPSAIREAWVRVAVERLEGHARGESGRTHSIEEVEAILAAAIRER